MKRLLFSIFCCVLVAGAFAQTYNMGSYNIRNQNDGDANNGNGWEQRLPVIVSMIEFYDFDVIGLQEVKYGQLKDLEAGLPDYGYIGVGRDDGKQAGEHSSIFYKKDRFELVDKGDFWLSTETTYPNKGWDAALPRICSWGKFRDKETKFEFMFFNLHLDHVGVIARQESVKLVMQKLQELGHGIPGILTGDFNVDQKTDMYGVIANSGIFFDSYQLAEKRYAWNGTFNNFRPDSFTEGRIDHIFVTKEFEVKRYGVLTDTYRTPRADSAEERSGNFPREVSYSRYDARVPSDHFPIMSVLKVK